jgi:hypothetical protein
MISPIFRNDPVEIVVPNSKYRQCVAVEKSKIYASVANRLHLSRYQGRRKAALGHLLDLKREIKLITIFIADGLQRLAALGAFLARAHVGPFRRALELQSEGPVELHD